MTRSIAVGVAAAMHPSLRPVPALRLSVVAFGCTENRVAVVERDLPPNGIEIRAVTVDETTVQLIAGADHLPPAYWIDVEVHVPADVALDLNDDAGDTVVDALSDDRRRGPGRPRPGTGRAG